QHETIVSNIGLLILAHTHVPTIWNDKNVVIENTDWKRDGEGLRSDWQMPNGVSFGATVQPVGERIEMELWLKNGTTETLSKLRTQICVLLKGAAAFNRQTNDNKVYGKDTVTVRDAAGGRSIV